MLQINNISCGYNSSTILKDISFSVAEKEILGIIGPNGSGKSTLVKTIASLLPPLSGEILFKENNIKNLTRNDLAKEITLLKQTSVLPSFSVMDFVLTGRIPYRKSFSLAQTTDDYKIASKALHFTKAYHLKDKLITNLSGGEQQLCKIAKALTQEPTLLIMDEPNTGLDISHQIQIMNLIQTLNTKFGLTVIMVLHDLNLASRYCHRLALMKDQHIYKLGTADEVITQHNVKAVYEADISVSKHPKTGTPYITLP